MSLAEQQQLEETYVMHTFGRKPVELVEGEGMVVRDDAGKEYLDFIAGIGAVSLGHCHPAVVRAITEQASTLIHVSNYYYIEHRGQVGKLLSDALNEDVPAADQAPWQTFFANSGAEANECAIKLARAYARRRVEAEGGDGEAAPRVIVTVKKSFHGRTLASRCPTASRPRRKTTSRRSRRCSRRRATPSALSCSSLSKANPACIPAAPSSWKRFAVSRPSATRS